MCVYVLLQANQGEIQASQLQDSVEDLNTEAADTEALLAEQLIASESELFLLAYASVFPALCLVHMSKIWICVVVCLPCMANILTLDITCKLFIPCVSYQQCLWAPLTSVIFYHFQ